MAESRRLKALLHKIRDGLDRSLDSLRQALAGSGLPDVQVNDADVKSAALYLRDFGLEYDGLRLHSEFARLQNRYMDEWLARAADGESQEYRDKLTELFGPFPSHGTPNDSIVADRRVEIVGWVAQLLEFVDELIGSVIALSSDGKPEADADRREADFEARRAAEQDSASHGTVELKGEAKALAVLLQHPDWTDARIAKECGCNRTTLYDWPKYKAARAALKEGRDTLPRGQKSAETGDLEAWE